MNYHDSAVDLINFDDVLSDEEKMIRNSVRSFTQASIKPVISQAYLDEKFPTELIAELGNLGLLGANIKGYGCAGLDAVAYGLALQELEAGDSGIRSFVSVQGALCMYAIYAFGSEKQKEKYLPAMAQGKLIGCFALTEPDFGSNPGGMLTNAIKDGDHYIINGSKRWITNGCIAGVAIVWAKYEGKIRGFLVEPGTPGFSTRKMTQKLSLRASHTSELFFDEMRIPSSQILEKSKNLGSALACLNQARFGIAFGAIGAAQACFAEALNYVQQRPIFDKMLSAYQLVQVKLADMATEISKAQLLALHLGRLKEKNGMLSPHQVSMAKMNNVRMALQVARTCRDMLGANGISAEYSVMRHMCNLETVNTYEGTEDIHKLILGEKITGVPAYKN